MDGVPDHIKAATFKKGRPHKIYPWPTRHQLEQLTVWIPPKKAEKTLRSLGVPDSEIETSRPRDGQLLPDAVPPFPIPLSFSHMLPQAKEQTCFLTQSAILSTALIMSLNYGFSTKAVIMEPEAGY
ncbi:hypothetical protein CIHG_05842 [Coccidioides immitis H538.4]|uniref:Uncharacterized protein n=1 Tax=Coccidioides immitis H538.4 TaxID=396776 RepID=A0A0J8RVH1_COCIT|nr:hypothetical protein CIHG_05842 [Coccidioides immitis H538.4]